MMMTMATDFSVDAVTARLCAPMEAAQNALADAILAACTPYVPYDTGRLCTSGHVLGGGADTPARIVWDVPYAHSVYYGDEKGYSYRRDRHPHASARWFERIDISL